MASHKQTKLYTLCVGTNVSDPIEARLDGDIITYQLPYDLSFISVLGLIHGELGTDEKLSRLFYLDDESEYIQVNTQDEYDIALKICKQSRNCLHVIVSGKDIQKKKLLDIEAVFVPNSTTMDQQDKPQVEEELETEAQSSMSSLEPTVVEVEGDVSPVLEEPKEIILSVSVVDEVKEELEENVVSAVENVEQSVEVTETIKQIIKQEVEVAVETKMRDILFKMPTVTVDGDNKFNEDEGSMELVTAEDIPPVNNDLMLLAVLVCENLLNATSKPNIKLQKYWVFRNDGTTAWNERTKLILEHETYDLNGTLYFKSERHEWGANVKKFQLPTLNQGETGVVEVVHKTPPFKCQYESCWRLEHNGTEFGERVRCCITVTDGTGTPVDNNSQQQMPTENVKQSSIVKQKNSFEQQNTRPHQEIPPTDDNISNMLSFNMTDISRVSGFLPQPEEPEAGAFEVPKGSIQSLSSHKSSNVDGISKAEESEKESIKVNTTEQQQEEATVEETRKEEDDIVTVEEEMKNEVEDVSEDHEEQPEADNDSDDLHSVDYDENTADNEFHSNDVSDFVVVLPECFDMNQPLSQEKSQETKSEEASSSEEESKETETPQSEESIPKQHEDEPPVVDQKIEEVAPTVAEEPTVVESLATDVPSIDESQSAVAQELPTPLPRSRQSVIDAEDNFSSTVPEQGSVAVSVPKIQVPRSVLNQDEAYPLPVQNTVSVPFEQGWRQDPIALPSGVTEEADDEENTGVKEPVAMEVQEVAIVDDVDEERADSGEFATPPLSIEPAQVVQPPVIEPSPLDQMYEMGFHNIDLNEEMLVRCEGDINRAVQALLMRSLADNSILPLD